MSKHPDNGPSFSKPTIKKSRPVPPSPNRKQAAIDEVKRESAQSRSVHERINQVGIVGYMKREK